MSLPREPYCLTGRIALLLGRGDELDAAIVATLTAAGARASQLEADDSPLVDSTPVNAAIADQSPEIFIFNPLGGEPSDSLAGADWELIDCQHRKLVGLPTAVLAKVVPAMRQHGWGRIIFVADGDAHSMGAIAARTAQAGLMRSEARRLASSGITLNQIVVKPPRSPLAADVVESIATAVLYFASVESAFVTGQSLQIGS